MRNVNWKYLKYLVDVVPDNPDKSKKKKYIKPELKKQIRERDKVCKICGMENKDGTDGVTVLQVHHIIPNGDSSETNLVLLCKYCHQTIHCLLYVIGKRGFVNLLRGFRW